MRLLLSLNLFTVSLFGQIMQGTGVRLLPPSGGGTPGISFQELKVNGTSTLNLFGPSSLATTVNFTLPNVYSPGAPGVYWGLCSDNTGVFTWCTPSGAGSYIDTTTNQVGLAGDKETAGVWTFSSRAIVKSLYPVISHTDEIGGPSNFFLRAYVDSLVSHAGSISIYDITGVTLQTTLSNSGFSTVGSFSNVNFLVNAAGNLTASTVAAGSGSFTTSVNIGIILTVPTINSTAIATNIISPIVNDTGGIGSSSLRYLDINAGIFRNYYSGGTQVANEWIQSLGTYNSYFSTGQVRSTLRSNGVNSEFFLFTTAGISVGLTPSGLSFSSGAAINISGNGNLIIAGSGNIQINGGTGQTAVCSPGTSYKISNLEGGVVIAGACLP